MRYRIKPYPITTLSLTLVLLFCGLKLGAEAATFTVTSLSDSGPGSLRDAITDANGNSGPDTIVFDVAGNISLSPTALQLNDPTGGTIIYCRKIRLDL